MKLSGDRNQCSGCDLYFNSTVAFEKHRVGEFGVDRRCLTVQEMLEKRMAVSSSGFWVTALMPTGVLSLITDVNEPTSSVVGSEPSPEQTNA